ncbi:hypothetical protein GGI43DRAFT_238135 [Trichoderma evansii]
MMLGQLAEARFRRRCCGKKRALESRFAWGDVVGCSFFNDFCFCNVALGRGGLSGEKGRLSEIVTSCHEQASFPSSLLLRYSATCFFYFLRISCSSSIFFIPRIIASGALPSLSGCISGLVPPTLSCEAAVIQAKFTTKSQSLYKIKKGFLFYTAYSIGKGYTQSPFLILTRQLSRLKTPARTNRRSQAVCNTTKERLQP